MFDQKPVEVLASYLIAMAIGAGTLFAVQKYGDWRAKTNGDKK